MSWSHEKSFKTVGDVKALDLTEALEAFVPDGSFSGRDDFQSRIQDEDSSNFQPPGEKVRSWTKDGRQYEIWAGQLTDPDVKALVDRAQILVTFFIEGGTHLELEDKEWTIARWRVFFLYEKLATPPTSKSSVYSFVGYSTTYRFLTFTKHTFTNNSQSATDRSTEFQFPLAEGFDALTMPYRGRISQFLIIPPHAHKGHGSMLYATIFKYFLQDPSCIEITVEDPNEAFDDLRDYCDFTRLLQNGTLEKIRMEHNLEPKLFLHAPGRRLPVDKIVDKNMLSTIRRENKLASRQFARLVELWTLSRIPSSSRQAGTARLTRKAKSTDEGDRAMYFWRLLVKSRIYKQNRDKFTDLESSEIVKHLEDTTDNLLGDYERLLGTLAAKALDGAANEVNEGEAGASNLARRGKRNLIVDDDDDDDDDESESRSKRQKSAIPSA